MVRNHKLTQKIILLSALFIYSLVVSNFAAVAHASTDI